jgi:hypothetical protein
LTRDYIQFFNQLQHAKGFLCQLASQSIKEFFDRAFAIRNGDRNLLSANPYVIINVNKRQLIFPPEEKHIVPWIKRQSSKSGRLFTRRFAAHIPQEGKKE